MRDDTAQKVEQIFGEALEKPAGQRAVPARPIAWR